MAALGRMCFQPVDLLSGEHIDLLHDETFASLRRLCASGLVGAAAAAPPCSAFSRSRLLPGGPPPIRTISHPRGKDRLSPPQATELATSSLIHVRCRELLALVAARGGLIWLENPTSSLLWLDSQVMAWCRTHTPFASTVAACAHSVPAHKSWTFMCNHDSISSVASTCTHPLGFHPALSGKRSSDGTFLTRRTAQYPSSLASLLASVASPFVDKGQAGHSVRGWASLLPAAPCWPPPSGRVEDGAGLCSSATPFPPTQSDVLGGLRKVWCKRLLDSGLHQQIASRLLSGSKTNPLSEAELAPSWPTCALSFTLSRTLHGSPLSPSSTANLSVSICGTVCRCFALIPIPTISMFCGKEFLLALVPPSRFALLCTRPLLRTRCAFPWNTANPPGNRPLITQTSWNHFSRTKLMQAGSVKSPVAMRNSAGCTNTPLSASLDLFLRPVVRLA